ncbi:ATP-binding cassette domain-containing protein [Neptuniibacter sp.]|uniref:ATP-binding cassette domain-containing protein n=1 Tax=Neptuniibacter sp. TaxID=1962643 RepID=UPI00263915A1|nr:ATP-binding cassette domain-containing protein [Neptuniibacter sp.]MCP4595841.1 ABC transporter ATP-binding protein [Neptuniibacter sp.]
MFEWSISGRQYAGQSVLGSLNLALERGETHCLVGASGCGKTTLLTTLAGLESGGDLKWNGKTPEIGYLFQQPRLLPWRTLKQNLMLIEPDEGRVLSMLEAVNLVDYTEYFPTRISLGMARRAALARCLLLEPDLVLMDEPLVSLDAPTAKQMRQLIQNLICKDPERCMIYVTHDLDEALEIGDKISVLGNSPSEIVYTANADDLSRESLEEILQKQFDQAISSN